MAMQTLPAYLAHLSSTYAPKTVKTYGGDVGELSLFLRGRKLGEITLGDLQEWRAGLTAPGQPLQEKTVARKVSAVINYFDWLHSSGAITAGRAAVHDPQGQWCHSSIETCQLGQKFAIFA
jgi:site-specific recombinase XerD